jgi:hypothetical protein
VINRRQFLRGAAGVSVALPMLSSLGTTARALPTKFPKRFIYFHTPNGSIPSAWTPTGGETDFTLSKILAPLEPHRKEILVLHKIDMESSYHGPGGDVGHANGMGHVLTGTELLAGGYEAAMGGGISLDQAIANRIAEGTKLKSMELGVQSSGPTGWIRVNYAAPGVSLPMQNDPVQVFDRVFGSLGADPLGVARIRAHRKSVLDAVTTEIAAVRTKVSSTDRDKLDTHLAAVRDIETRLDAAPLLGAHCKKPTRPAELKIAMNDNYPTLAKLQIDQLVMSMACDLTRVGTLLFAGAANNAQVFDWIGLSQSHHQLTHAAPSEANESIVKVMNWYASQFAYLIAAMKAIPEGTGTMLDNSVLLWGSELSVGNSHSRREMPFVMAGSGGGYFKTGRFLTFPSGTPHNDLLVSIANAMGVPGESFGNPAYCNGPLAKLRG